MGQKLGKQAYLCPGKAAPLPPAHPHSLSMHTLRPTSHKCDNLPYQEGTLNFDAPACQMMSRLLLPSNIAKYVCFFKGWTPISTPHPRTRKCNFTSHRNFTFSNLNILLSNLCHKGLISYCIHPLHPAGVVGRGEYGEMTS